MTLPLADIRIVDFSQNVAAPSGAMLLADQGADVIKVEPPGGGNSRTNTPAINGMTFYFMSWNRNKRSIMVDVTKDEGRAVTHDLARWADVFITNSRLDARRRHGYSYKDLAAVNSRLIYVSLTGYGEAGPEANLPGADITIQARAGEIAARRISDGPYPQYTRLFHYDMGTAMLIAYGVMVAVHERQQTGKGQQVQVNLLQTALTLHTLQMTHLAGSSERSPARPESLPIQYMCSDGRQLLSQTINTGRRWEEFLDAVRLEKLATDPRFDTLEKRQQGLAELTQVIAQHFATKPAAEWEAMFKRKELSATVVKEIELDEVDEDPQVIANDMMIEFQQPEVGPMRATGQAVRLSAHAQERWLRLPAPTLGEHTAEILAQLGYTPQRIQALRGSGAVA